jgi:antitoxin PrlF
MIDVRSISSKGQVVVPKKIREYLGAKNGDQMGFSINDKGEVTIDVVKEPDLMDLYGTLPPKNKTEKSTEQIIKEAKEERIERKQKEGKL